MTQPKELQEQEAEGFLHRWSQKKQEAKINALEPTQPVEPEVEAPPPLTDEDMPPIESLTETSDFSGFLSPEVSEELRRVALRKLFNTALFGQRDGLDDYDDDFTSFAKLGDIVTADMRHQMEMAKEKLEQMAEAPSDVENDKSKDKDDPTDDEASEEIPEKAEIEAKTGLHEPSSANEFEVHEEDSEDEI
jgi:hypothetical protein